MKHFDQGRVATLVLGIAIASGFVACGGSTTIEESWREPTQAPSNLRNVVTVYSSRDATTRRAVEDSMARRLAGIGVRAVPAYSVLSDDDLVDRDRVKAKLLAGGYDGVVALRLVGKDTKLVATPATFNGYWGAAWPGSYVDTETIVRVETNVFSLADNKLVWSALSKTVDPTTLHSTIDDVTKVVAKALENQRIVATTGRPTAPS
jgi:hypothetical protein